MHYAKIKYFDVANGPGIRTSLFVSGCSNHCKGCFNPETWDPNYGNEFTDEEIEKIIESVDDNIAGISILGGDPLEIYNLIMVKKLITEFRKKFNFEKDIWLWSGYTIENIINDRNKWDVVKDVDVLVEGPYVEKKRNLNLKFRGSSNQQIIDIQASQTFNTCILKEEYME